MAQISVPSSSAPTSKKFRHWVSGALMSVQHFLALGVRGFGMGIITPGVQRYCVVALPIGIEHSLSGAHQACCIRVEARPGSVVEVAPLPITGTEVDASIGHNVLCAVSGGRKVTSEHASIRGGVSGKAQQV